MKQTTEEIGLDILIFANILIKFGFEDTVENNRLFTHMVNEAGFRTARGKEFTYMGLRQMLKRLPKEVKQEAIADIGSNDIVFDYLGFASCDDAVGAENE